MRTYQIPLTCFDSERRIEPVDVTVVVHANDRQEALRKIRTVYVGEDGSVSFTGGHGRQWYPEWKAGTISELPDGRLPEEAAAELANLRDRVKAGPDHGVTREQAVHVLDGFTVPQLKEVAKKAGLPVIASAKKKEDLVRLISNFMVDSTLDHHAAVGYDGHPPAWTGRQAAPKQTAARAATADEPAAQRGTGRTLDVEGAHMLALALNDMGVHTPEAYERLNRDLGEEYGRARARDVERRIRDNIRRISTDSHGKFVSMQELRESLPDVDRDEFDDAMQRVARHNDVFVQPTLAGARHWTDKVNDTDRENAVEFGGQRQHSVFIEPGSRNQRAAAEQLTSCDPEDARSYTAVLTPEELDTLAGHLGIEADPDPDVTRERIAQNAAANRDRWLADARQRTADLTLLYEAEKAGTSPDTWKPEERAAVAAAARRQQDNEWAPGRRRARQWLHLPEDGSVPTTGPIPDPDACRKCGKYEYVSAQRSVCLLCATDGDKPAVVDAEVEDIFAASLKEARPDAIGHLWQPGAAKATWCNLAHPLPDGHHAWGWSGGDPNRNVVQGGPPVSFASLITCPVCSEKLAVLAAAEQGPPPFVTTIAPAPSGTKLEFNYDRIVAAHDDATRVLDEQYDRMAKANDWVVEAAEALDGMDRQRATAVAACEAMMEGIRAAQLDAESLSGVVAAAESLDVEQVDRLFERLDTLEHTFGPVLTAFFQSIQSINGSRGPHRRHLRAPRAQRAGDRRAGEAMEHGGGS